MYHLGALSLANLDGVHPDLVAVVKRAIKITKQDFMVFEGLRDTEIQREYVKRGVSWTMDSRHITGHAVDLVPWIARRARWEEEPCRVVAEAIMHSAEALKIPVNWGVAMWGKDGVHYQLPRSQYP